MRRMLVLSGALLLASCSPYTPAPLAPAPIPAASDTAPHWLSLEQVIGTGENGGHATLTARVQSLGGHSLRDIDVVFTTDVGTFAPAHIATNADGYAASVLTASASANVTVTAGALSTKTIIVALPPIVIPPPTPPRPPPPPPVVPGPAPPAYLVRVSLAPPSPINLGVPTTLTADAFPYAGTLPASSFEWDCTNDGTIDATTVGNTQVCTFTGADTPLLLVLTSSTTVTPAIGQSVTVTAMIRSMPTPQVTARGPAGAIGIGGATVTIDWGAVKWEWDDTSDGVVDATTTAASPNARTTTFATAGTYLMRVVMTEPISGRQVSAVLTIYVHP